MSKFCKVYSWFETLRDTILRKTPDCSSGRTGYFLFPIIPNDLLCKLYRGTPRTGIKNKVFLISTFFISSIFPFHLDNQEIYSLAKRGENIKRTDITNFFRPVKQLFGQENIVTDPLKLQKAAKLALKYFRENKRSNPKIVKPKVFDKKILNSNKVEKTLKFIIWSIENDKKRKRGFRILDPKFLNKNFKFIKWSGDTKAAYKNNVKIPENFWNWGILDKGKIRLTKYAIFTFNGSYKKTAKYCCPLYKIIDKNFAKKDRFRYTKQDVLNGVLQKPQNRKKVKPLVWLTRAGMEDAIMQGTVLVRMPNKKELLFNVDKSNGIAYNKKVKDIKRQKRYWYFKQVKRDKASMKNSILNHGGAVFAGDIYNIGLGKIIAIKYKNPVNKKEEIRLGVLNDVGGAFVNNLYQLDLFAGVFRNRCSFNRWIRKIPNAVQAYILVKS